ncbi:WYL domain-containing protein [Corynebacterium pseudotuberculosis]|uniref:WYL domain-containing protein n=1 Tax=Corynebacterium pseudotuberculosis 258 TaxID=1168865 RepID=A0AAU8PLD1_CORPS|nr:WYL domain-containing protein [Corynebacterium pseudotuberculosis]AER69084.1 Protein pafB [Corynebacterium pseudotuberculosis 1/06-A]AEQ06586.2 WYL domain-containing protein [Corynebacterium pseudotuberculosis CIP 52.97]AFB72383.1 WYL domain-containing protein [Corynebacterium pseudotuberculosis 316]AFH90858.1 WYL domain-containing protein [Corynebacterium pseudotuberculosis 31]AFK16680.1 WYL domain-containing protein [Corynebacterium pseudotuberculosis 258]
MKKDTVMERIVNVTFAFLNAESRGHHYLTAEWIIENVEGYKKNPETGETRSYEAAHQLFKRDRTALIRAGVPIETVATNSHTAYRLQVEEYPLKKVNFTPEEATVLALAGQMGLGDELAAFSRSGWTKIAASGIDRELTATPRFHPVNDWNSLSVSHFDSILEACRNNKRIHFEYLRNKASVPQWRTMDPWGIVSHRDRLYLVGFDIERQEKRVFRLTRIISVSKPEDIAPGDMFHSLPPETNLQKLVEEQLRQGQVLVNATVEVKEGHGLEFSSRGTLNSDGSYSLIDVDRDWLIRTAVALAPAVVVIEPPEVVSDIVSLLSSAAEEA